MHIRGIPVQLRNVFHDFRRAFERGTGHVGAGWRQRAAPRRRRGISGRGLRRVHPQLLLQFLDRDVTILGYVIQGLVLGPAVKPGGRARFRGIFQGLDGDRRVVLGRKLVGWFFGFGERVAVGFYIKISKFNVKIG